MKDVILPSGKTLKIPDFTLAQSMKLIRVLAKELKQVGIEFSIDELSDLRKFANKDVSCLKDIFLQLIGSEELVNTITQMCTTAMYEDDRFNAPGIWDTEEGKGDYFPMLWEVLKAALTPFFKPLVSKSNQEQNGK